MDPEEPLDPRIQVRNIPSQSGKTPEKGNEWFLSTYMKREVWSVTLWQTSLYESKQFAMCASGGSKQ